jgi:hypothetical protein
MLKQKVFFFFFNINIFFTFSVTSEKGLVQLGSLLILLNSRIGRMNLEKVDDFIDASNHGISNISPIVATLSLCVCMNVFIYLFLYGYIVLESFTPDSFMMISRTVHRTCAYYVGARERKGKQIILGKALTYPPSSAVCF